MQVKVHDTVPERPRVPEHSGGDVTDHFLKPEREDPLMQRCEALG